jgi:predicted Holliday junction resolvase-like endonuclease
MKKQIFATSLFVMAVFTTALAQKISLTKGQKIASTVLMKMNVKIEMMGQAIENNTESTSTSEAVVKEVTSKDFLITNTLKRVVTSIAAMGQEMKFDSDKKEDLDGQMGEAFKDQINKPKDVLVGKDARIIESGEDKTKEKVAVGLNNIINTNLVKGQYYPLLTPLPAAAAKVGYSWVDSSGSDSSRKITTYKLKTIKGNDLVVAYTTAINQKGTVLQNGMSIKINITGSSKGESLYEKNTGLLKTDTATNNFTGTMELMGQESPLTMVITTFTTVKKIS